MANIFNINNLYYSYNNNDKEVFYNLTLNVPKSGLTVISGDNGSGKTTLCRLLLGLNRGYRGSIKLDGQELSNLKQEAILNSIIYIKQDIAGSFLGVTPEEDLSIWQNRFQTEDSQEKKTERKEALEKMGIISITDTPIWELSYGQRRKVMLSALALFSEKYWIIDEPSASLDSKGIRFLLNIIKSKITTKLGCLVLTHRTELFNDLCLENGTAWKLTDNGQIEKLF